MPNNDPWYSRTEFWTTVGNIVMQLAGVLHFGVPAAVGLGLAGAGTMVYTFGRGSVKAAQAAGALSALGGSLSAKK